MPNIGLPEIIIILVIALIVIGPGRLPDVGAALGKSIREFRKASSDLTEATRVDTAAATTGQTPTAQVPAAAPPVAQPAPAPNNPPTADAPSAAPAPTP